MAHIRSSKTGNCALCRSDSSLPPSTGPCPESVTFYALHMHFSRLLYCLRTLFSGIWCRVFWKFPDPFTPLS